MFEAFLINTSSEGLKPLGTTPQRSFELISDSVRAKFGDRHAALFAEPVATQYGDRFDWYATLAGKPAALKDLEDSETARAVLGGLVSDIKGYSDELLRSKSPEDQRLGEALANALEVPGEDSIFVLTTDGAEGENLQPVLVNWAWALDEQSAVRGVLTGIDSRAESTQRTAAPIAAMATGAAAAGATGLMVGRAIWWWLLWLGWLLLALMIAAMIYLLVEPCGLRVSWLSNNCPVAQSRAISPMDERLILEDRITSVQRQIGIADRACQPDNAGLAIPEPTPRALPQAPVISDADRRLAEAGAQRGDLTFTLIWDGADDLDLSVTCPSNARLFYLKKAVCNGVLDVDSNVAQIAPNPVENAYYTNPSPGKYKVQIRLYKSRDGVGAGSFTLQIRDGEQLITKRASILQGGEIWQFTYDYGGK